jgi:hypothetical protein
MAPLARRASYLTVVLALVVASSTSSAPAPPGASVRQAAVQARRVEKADITLNSYSTGDGTINVDGRGGDLQFHKQVRSNGSYRLTLRTPHDNVAISFEEHTITITRDKKSVAIALGVASADDFDRAHKMLADSRAASLMRVAAANVQESEDDSPESASFLMADAVIGMLTGDSAAPARVARHLARHFRSTLRPVMMQVDCYTTWESRVNMAYDEYAGCMGDFSVWDPTRYLCAARFLLQAESYWFTFISCSGFSQF